MKAVQVESSAPAQVPSVPPATTKQSRTNSDWKTGIIAATFLSRNVSESKPASPVPEQRLPVREPSLPQTALLNFSLNPTPVRINLENEKGQDITPNGLIDQLEYPVRPVSPRTSTPRLGEIEETSETVLDTFEGLNTEATLSGASSIYSGDSASIYSRTSSIYSSGASTYSYDECGSDDFDQFNRKASRDELLYQQHARTLAIKRQEVQDTAARERSSLAKKAALFQNSRLQPQLPSYSASLPTWSMVCRAVQASQDCYDSRALTRKGAYTPADSSKDIKAMIVDDQFIDGSRLVIVSIRGTQFQSLRDWTVNTAANPTNPSGFLDDEENLCHAGFLQVAKAMVNQIASQLQQHPASSEKPSLLFTGHSAGGAVAALLYSHMVSTSVNSKLTALASQFPSINCITFGAPPLTITPLPRPDIGSGVFLAFANEGDPVLRLSNAAYFKTLAKLMTASPPPSTAAVPVAPPVKVVRGSRGGTVYRQPMAAPPAIPWEELPLWPTPAASLYNGGDVILLRDKKNGRAEASRLTYEDLGTVIFGDFVQHTTEMYVRRVNEVALAAMMGRNV